MSDVSKTRELKRKARHRRIRKKISGTSERPRLYVHRSLKNFYAQIIDDNSRKIICGISTLNKDVQKKIKFGGNIEAAQVLGEIMAQEATSKGVKSVSFDRGGYRFHGRVKAFVDGAHKGGLEF